MKFIYLIVLGLCFIQCSNSKHESDSSDSTITSTESATIPTIHEGDSLAIAIDNAIHGLDDQFVHDSINYYTIRAIFNGHESNSASTWYFDHSFKLKHCNGNWSAEASGERYTYYFKNEVMQASVSEGEEQDSTTSFAFHTGIAPVYGYRKTGIYDQQEELTTTYLYKQNYEQENSNAKKRLTDLLNIVKNNLDSATYSNEEVYISIRNKVNFGMNTDGMTIIEKEEYHINKALFDKLIKN